MKTRNMLVLCKENAARSVMVETLINGLSKGEWRAYSAASHPASTFNAYTVLALRERGFAVDTDRQPKSLIEFTRAEAPRFDVVLTVCEDISWEKLPTWPGAPRLLHWTLPDPTASNCTPTERADVFRAVLDLSERKVCEFLEEERHAVRVGPQANDNRHLADRAAWRFGT
ncbi:MAG: arsenate reductase ArsC [Hyphomicrobiaceae bacterium]|nr:arsenate reductase ArsC [Hyphomicrobiaceae bacterium]